MLLLAGTLVIIWYCIRRRRKNSAAGQGRDRSQVDDAETDDMSSASGSSFSRAFDPPFTFRGAVNHGASLVNPRPFFWKNNIPLNELPDNFHTPKVRHISNINLSVNYNMQILKMHKHDVQGLKHVSVPNVSQGGHSGGRAGRMAGHGSLFSKSIITRGRMGAQNDVTRPPPRDFYAAGSLSRSTRRPSRLSGTGSNDRGVGRFHDDDDDDDEMIDLDRDPDVIGLDPSSHAQSYPGFDPPLSREAADNDYFEANRRPSLSGENQSSPSGPIEAFGGDLMSFSELPPIPPRPPPSVLSGGSHR